VCSEMLGFKLQTPGNNPEESVRHLLYKLNSLFSYNFHNGECEHSMKQNGVWNGKCRDFVICYGDDFQKNCCI
jgi:hypothetical protein